MAKVVLYGVVIQQAIATGDLQRMKKLAKEAEQHLKDYGDIRASLELLKVEIAKAERRR